MPGGICCAATAAMHKTARRANMLTSESRGVSPVCRARRALRVIAPRFCARSLPDCSVQYSRPLASIPSPSTAGHIITVLCGLYNPLQHTHIIVPLPHILYNISTTLYNTLQSTALQQFYSLQPLQHPSERSTHTLTYPVGVSEFVLFLTQWSRAGGSSPVQKVFVAKTADRGSAPPGVRSSPAKSRAALAKLMALRTAWPQSPCAQLPFLVRTMMGRQSGFGATDCCCLLRTQAGKRWRRNGKFCGPAHLPF